MKGRKIVDFEYIKNNWIGITARINRTLKDNSCLIIKQIEEFEASKLSYEYTVLYYNTNEKFYYVYKYESYTADNITLTNQEQKLIINKYLIKQIIKANIDTKL